MALPTAAQQKTLDFTDWSLPVVFVDAKSGINSTNLDFTDWSLPVFGQSVSGGAADPTNVIYIKTGASTWSQASNIYIKTGASTWQEVSALSIKTGSSEWNT